MTLKMTHTIVRQVYIRFKWFQVKEYLSFLPVRERKKTSFVLQEFIISRKGSQFYGIAASLNGMLLDRINGRQWMGVCVIWAEGLSICHWRGETID